MKRLFVLLLVLAFPAAADEPAVSAEAFTQEVVRALEARLPADAFEVTGPLTIVLNDGAPRSGTMNLHNVHRSVSADPAEREVQIATFLNAILVPATETLSVEDRANVLPVVRDRDFVEQAETANPEDTAIVMPLVADLSVMYVLDFPDRVQFLKQTSMAELEVDLAGLHALAIANLGAKSDQYRVQTIEGIYFLELDGMYESSALVLDDFWPAIEERIGAPPVAAIPTRDILIFAPSNDPLGIELVRELATMIEADTGYPISTTLLIRNNGSWEPYQ